MLAPETSKVWEFVKDEPLLAGFILIGGSGLAIHLKHRISEDLDLTITQAQLPRKRLETFVKKARTQGFLFEGKSDPAAVEEFASVGLELEDYQQDFVVNNRVKVSFFTAEESLCKILKASSVAGPGVASLEELFKSKALVSARRSKSRDWLDLYLLLDHGYTLSDYRQAFQEGGVPYEFEIGLQRLCSGKPQNGDEGYMGILENAPTIEQMREFFRAERDKFEQNEAAKVLREVKGNQRAKGAE